ncbi:hypothetical protein COCC4DRAFT_128688 [Bipolaris maydis ATCC 48331]|uniref:Uncharacterized protein n=2 Tax=Cochliobolus heterostrophus TaxID=5016 RepID=M2T179_COCH5|nr:uncharacterized protein COCC4DRAFT_128688 [Bipolaris maydis ATCC 48331]EMD91330.1 hypothetical protein COCHEDRAFT_1155716 [Bipolaris maydis C5]ENI08913.1 hypothetical protein COCC4DRAFT_128688 [Bipolaris maydis ATCC 48331]
MRHTDTATRHGTEGGPEREVSVSQTVEQYQWASGCLAVCETHHWAVSIWALAFAYMKPGMWLDEILIEFGSGPERVTWRVVQGGMGSLAAKTRLVQTEHQALYTPSVGAQLGQDEAMCRRADTRDKGDANNVRGGEDG